MSAPTTEIKRPAGDPPAEASISRRRQVWRSLWSNPAGKTAVLLVLAIALVAIFSPLIATHNPNQQDLLAVNQAPSGAHWLGTDPLGRDVFSRIVVGLRASLLIGVITATATAVLGLALGLLAGYFERVLGNILLRLADIQFSVPFVLVGIALAAVFGPGIVKLMVVLTFWGWTIYARTIASTVSQVRRMDFVRASQTVGASVPRILFRQIAPNVMGPVVILWSTAVGALILAESGLSLLGLGIAPPSFSLGSMLADSQTTLQLAWWAAVFPGIAIALLVLTFNLLGDGLRDALNPAFATAGRHDPVLS